MPTEVFVGDRIRLSGGYDQGPGWLCGASHFDGVIAAFIPGQNVQQAAVVRLESPITFEGVTGEYVVLELRYGGAEWNETDTVHVELCDFYPEAKAWQHRRQGQARCEPCALTFRCIRRSCRRFAPPRPRLSSTVRGQSSARASEVSTK